MPYLVGVDEAGYGPNLGPLVISATAWQVPDDDWQRDLYQRLQRCISRKTGRDAARIAIADSKQLYKPGGGLRLLERGLLPALSVLGRRVDRWRQVWDALEADRQALRHKLPWYTEYDAPLPTDLSREDSARLAASLAESLAASGVRLVSIRSRAVFPAEFNALVEQHGTKGAALSQTTLVLVAELLSSFDDHPVLVACDKHGGRNRYRDLLQQAFPERLVEVYGESRSQSVYRFGPADARVEIRFSVGGESFLPAALASMASKYLRELSMQAFNTFWCRQVPALRPTAGYPVDAKRFKADIAAVQENLNIDDRELWRCR